MSALVKHRFNVSPLPQWKDVKSLGRKEKGRQKNKSFSTFTKLLPPAPPLKKKKKKSTPGFLIKQINKFCICLKLACKFGIVSQCSWTKMKAFSGFLSFLFSIAQDFGLVWFNLVICSSPPPASFLSLCCFSTTFHPGLNADKHFFLQRILLFRDKQVCP